MNSSRRQSATNKTVTDEYKTMSNEFQTISNEELEGVRSQKNVPIYVENETGTTVKQLAGAAGADVPAANSVDVSK